MSSNDPRAYHRAKIRLLLGLLALWFFVSYGCGIIFREWLDENMFKIGNAPFGFWMAQQGSIVCFVFLLLAYNFLMNRLDEKHGYGAEEGDQS